MKLILFGLRCFALGLVIGAMLGWLLKADAQPVAKKGCIPPDHAREFIRKADAMYADLDLHSIKRKKRLEA